MLELLNVTLIDLYWENVEQPGQGVYTYFDTHQCVTMLQNVGY